MSLLVVVHVHLAIMEQCGNDVDSANVFFDKTNIVIGSDTIFLFLYR